MISPLRHYGFQQTIFLPGEIMNEQASKTEMNMFYKSIVFITFSKYRQYLSTIWRVS